MMDLAKAKEDPLYSRARYWFVMLLKERFRNKTDDTLEKFHSLMKKHMQKEIDTNNLISEVNTLFNGHPDLISEFNYFMPRDQSQSTSIEHDPKEIVYLDQRLHKSAIKACLDYANRARLILKDDGKFNAFADVLIRFQEHEDIDQMREEACPLLKDYPGLEIELSKFLAATVERRHNKRRKKNVFAFYEVRKDDEFSHGRGGGRVHTKYEEKFFDWEDDMYKRDMKFRAWDSALKAAQNLICENSGKDPGKRITMGEYFSNFNLKCLENSILDKYLVHGRRAPRYKVMRRSEMIVSCLEMGLVYLKKEGEDMKVSLNNLMFANRDETCRREFHATMSALDATEQLILENSERDPEEYMNMREYFSTLNVTHLEKLNLHEYLSDHKTKEMRYEVIQRSEFIASCLELVLEYLEAKRAIMEYLKGKPAYMEKRSEKKRKRKRS